MVFVDVLLVVGGQLVCLPGVGCLNVFAWLRVRWFNVVACCGGWLCLDWRCGYDCYLLWFGVF